MWANPTDNFRDLYVTPYKNKTTSGGSKELRQYVFNHEQHFEEQEDYNSPDDKDLKNLLILHHVANTKRVKM